MPTPFKTKSHCLFLLALLLCQLVACAPAGKLPKATGNAEDYRRQAYQAIYEKRLNDGITSLQQAISLEPMGSDYLLLGDLQEANEQYRAALKAYQKGIQYAFDAKTREELNFHWATLEAFQYDRLDKATELIAQLPADSAAALNLRTIQSLQRKHFDTALQHSEQVVSDNQDQEMTGLAHYLAAQAWLNVGNESKAFQSLFFAINHARGHGLVARITRLWEELKKRPLPQ